MKHAKTSTIVLNKGAGEELRELILGYFHDTYTLDEKLYDILSSDDAFYLKAEPLRHPLIFYLGHTAVFYINKLIIAKITDKRIHPKFESMFAVGVDEMSWDDLNEANYDWPSVDEVMAYRKKVRDRVDEIIRTLPLSIPINWESPFWAIMMGIEHQRIHLETSSVIIRRLPIHIVRDLPEWEICKEFNAPPENRLIPVKGSRVILGKPRDHALYGWDNEYGTHTDDISFFSASKYLVSNHEFLPFVQDNGYSDMAFWTEEGQEWMKYCGHSHPVFWVKSDSSYKLRTLSKVIDMPWSWPVEVNYLEAKAFCNWQSQKKGMPIRLPTESEWYRLRNLEETPDSPYWDKAPGNINLEYWASPCPVNRFQIGDFFDVIGNVWQWTETPISGFEGFKIHPYYDDFSTPTFDTRHNLIKGGSWISTGNEATYHARYAFRRHFFQHAGFRYIHSEKEVLPPEAMYETDRDVSQYVEAHYGEKYFDVDNFPETVAQICIEYMAGREKNRALDLGCAVGRTSFELARSFDHVTGLDFSARFIRIAIQLKEKGVTHYERIEEGMLVSYQERTLIELGITPDIARKTEFYQADASNMKPQFTNYDLIIAANLLDRLYDPRKFLTTIHDRLKLGGLFILTSPYTWLETFTQKENWIGGFRKDGEPYTTLDGMKECLSPHFRMIASPRDIPFVIRETQRKFQHTLSQLTVWERKK